MILPGIMRPLLLLVLLVALPLGARACLNDRDSDALAVQNGRVPDALRVVSGRFERNPPRFYQMRIARVSGELKVHPRDFGLYDDLAVAHDKLGDDEAALRVMAAKRAQLPAYNAHDKANKEAWYRFFANDGTFRAHLFLHAGAPVAGLGEMKQARAEIARALRIKPNAHFGREKYQVAVMDWVVLAKTGKTELSLGDWMQARFKWDGGYDWPRQPLAPQNQEAAQGLAGLIVLGAAWRSPDVFDALATALEARPTIALSYLARHRSQELLAGGAKSLQPKAVLPLDEYWLRDRMDRGLNDTNAKTLDAFYPKLRADAEAWQTRRAAWMNARFVRGEHPDTDADFWRGWQDSAPMSLDVAWYDTRAETQRIMRNAKFIALSTVLGVPTLLLVACFWFARRRRAKRQNAPT